MSHDHMPQTNTHRDAHGNELPPIDDRSVQAPEPRFRDDAEGQKIRDDEAEAKRLKKARKTLRVTIGGGVVTALGAGVALGGSAYLDHREAAATDQRIDKIFEEANQYPYEKIPASIIPEVGIPASVFSTPQEVVDEYYAQENAWINFGYTDEQRAAKDWGFTPKSDRDETIMGPVNDAYMDGLYSYPSEDLTFQVIDENIAIHNVTTTNQEATDTDTVLYRVEHTPIETQLYDETPESFTAGTEWMTTQNIDMDVPEQYMESGTKFMSTLDFVLVDGEWKVEHGYKTQISY